MPSCVRLKHEAAPKSMTDVVRRTLQDRLVASLARGWRHARTIDDKRFFALPLFEKPQRNLPRFKRLPPHDQRRFGP
jgi:hypothetical protein